MNLKPKYRCVLMDITGGPKPRLLIQRLEFHHNLGEPKENSGTVTSPIVHLSWVYKYAETFNSIYWWGEKEP